MRAVYYCRVSTEEESQVNALESQIQEAKNCIAQNSWYQVDGYVDEGKSGTQTKKRDEYNRLLCDLEEDKFDVIVIKSQDRLMRNVKDWYIFIDKLVTNNKRLFFYLDNKFYTPDDALITGIKAILAEEFSRDLSKKLNKAHRTRQEKGKSIVITSSTWGYDKIKKQVVINEKEAEIVRKIFDLYISGYGSRTISKELSNMGIKSRSGNDFAEVTIRRIIRNPLFKGTVVMNKRHKDFDTKKTSHNPKEEWIYHENAVPAIVTNEVWEKANSIMDKKSKEVKSDEFKSRRIGVNIGKYDLSGKIVCGECQSTYWRRYRKNVKGDQIVDWSCSEYVKRGRKKIVDTRGKNKLKVKTKDGGCDNIHIKDEDIINVLALAKDKVFNQDSDVVINKIMNLLRSTINTDNIKKERESLELEKNKIINHKNLLMDKLLEDVITNEDYKRKDAELEIKLTKLLEQEGMLKARENKSTTLEKRVEKIKEMLETKGTELEKLNKFIEHLTKIVVKRNVLEIYLDMYEPILVEVNEVNKKSRKYLLVDSSKYLIPHTDKYRYDGKYREVDVKLYA